MTQPKPRDTSMSVETASWQYTDEVIQTINKGNSIVIEPNINECVLELAFTSGASFMRDKVIALLRSEETQHQYLDGDLSISISGPKDWANWLEKNLK